MKNLSFPSFSETSHEQPTTKRARISRETNATEAPHPQLTDNIGDLNDFINDFKNSTSEDVDKLFENHSEFSQAEDNDNIEFDTQTIPFEENSAEIDPDELAMMRKKFEVALKLKFCEIIKETNENTNNKEKIQEKIVKDYSSKHTLHLEIDINYGSGFFLLHKKAYSKINIQATLEKIFENEQKPFNIEPYKNIAKKIANNIRNKINIRFYCPFDGGLNVKIAKKDDFINFIENCTKGTFDNDENDPKIQFNEMIESNFRSTIEQLKKENISILDNITEIKGRDYLLASEFSTFNDALILVDERTYTKKSIELLLRQLQINKFPLSSLDEGKMIASDLRKAMGIGYTIRTPIKNETKRRAPQDQPTVLHYKIEINKNRFTTWINNLSENKATNETASNPSIQTPISKNTQPSNSEKSIAGYSDTQSILLFSNSKTILENNSEYQKNMLRNTIT